MNDQKDVSSIESNDSNSGILASAYNAVTDLVSGSSIPTPIKKNAFKAFGQLCTAAIDIPVAYLEGIATEKRAETQARVKIISTGADKIAEQMDVDPEFARVAVKKYGQKIVREQVNLDKISEIAANEIRQDLINSEAKPDETTETALINEDWLNNFEKEASQKSTQEMQLLFGRILAREIQRPNSFSIKTVKLLGELDSIAASLFRRLCSLCIYLKLGSFYYLDARVLSLGGNAGSNALESYGLGFGQLNILHEYGLIIPDYNSYFDYQMCLANESNTVNLAFWYQNCNYGLIPNFGQPINQELKLSGLAPLLNTGRELRLSGVALSSSGRELLRIVNIEPLDNYTTALIEFFARQNLSMVKITN